MPLAFTQEDFLVKLCFSFSTGYQSILKRLCSTMTMTAIKPVNKNTEHNSEETFAPELDLGNFVETFPKHT